MTNKGKEDLSIYFLNYGKGNKKVEELNMKSLEKVVEELQNAVFECDKVECEITKKHVKFIYFDEDKKDVEFTITHENLDFLMSINSHRTSNFILNYLLDKEGLIKYKYYILLRIRNYYNGKTDKETTVNFLETYFNTIGEESTKKYFKRDVIGFLNDIDKQRKESK